MGARSGTIKTVERITGSTGFIRHRDFHITNCKSTQRESTGIIDILSRAYAAGIVSARKTFIDICSAFNRYSTATVGTIEDVTPGVQITATLNRNTGAAVHNDGTIGTNLTDHLSGGLSTDTDRTINDDVCSGFHCQPSVQIVRRRSRCTFAYI